VGVGPAFSWFLSIVFVTAEACGVDPARDADAVDPSRVGRCVGSLRRSGQRPQAHLREFEVVLLDYGITCNHLHLLLDGQERMEISGLMRTVAGEVARAASADAIPADILSTGANPITDAQIAAVAM